MYRTTCAAAAPQARQLPPAAAGISPLARLHCALHVHVPSPLHRRFASSTAPASRRSRRLAFGPVAWRPPCPCAEPAASPPRLEHGTCLSSQPPSRLLARPHGPRRTVAVFALREISRFGNDNPPLAQPHGPYRAHMPNHFHRRPAPGTTPASRRGRTLAFSPAAWPPLWTCAELLASPPRPEHGSCLLPRPHSRLWPGRMTPPLPMCRAPCTAASPRARHLPLATAAVSPFGPAVWSPLFSRSFGTKGNHPYWH